MDIDSLLNTTTDCLRFVTEFFEVISQSAPHIYHSALPLTPQSSIVWKLYGQQTHSLIARVVRGIPITWDSCTASAGVETEPCDGVWSPCGKFIAVNSKGGVEIQDSNTLEKLFFLRLHDPMDDIRSLAFSPDGHLLACTLSAFERTLPSVFPSSRYTDSIPRNRQNIVTWDIQTGIIIKEFEIWVPSKITFCGNRRTITRVMGQYFCAHDVLNGTQSCEGKLLPSTSHQLGAKWAYGESLQFAITDGKFAIHIQELQPTSDPSVTVVKSFPVPPHKGEFSFSPVSFHASFVTKRSIVILNVQGPRMLFHTTSTQPLYAPPGHFSPDGSFFACGTLENRIHLWKNIPPNYIPWCTHQPRI